VEESSPVPLLEGTMRTLSRREMRESRGGPTSVDFQVLLARILIVVLNVLGILAPGGGSAFGPHGITYPPGSGATAPGGPVPAA
jgi:hypothetical protein